MWSTKWRVKVYLIWGLMLLAWACTANAQTKPSLPLMSGEVRLQWDQRNANAIGPLALANALQSGTVAQPFSGATVEAELRSSSRDWRWSATAQQLSPKGGTPQSRAWMNEAVLSGTVGEWRLDAGKKIVAWDVGQAFRPNDVVQQEERRTLVSTLSEGRPVLMAEHFDADAAWALVWVNPTALATERRGSEPALAARYYLRQGAVDWHGFARAGARTGASVGAAAAWVATDAVELHASVRLLSGADSKAMVPLATPLSTNNPWQATGLGASTQALVGGTWTHETSLLSLLAEAWWDGTALSPEQWGNWRTRNRLLASQPGLGAPASAVAGNLAWQGDAFGASGSLHRENIFLRLSWDYEGWQPALDVLYHPADGGRMWTAALLFKGDKVQVQSGFRVSTGPADSILMQLPAQRQAFLSSRWMF